MEFDFNFTASYLFAFVMGLFSSLHCIGMCGGIAATMSLGTKSVGGAICRQGCWSLGRTLTYMFLGVAASAVGAKFLRSQGNAVWLQAVLETWLLRYALLLD